MFDCKTVKDGGFLLYCEICESSVFIEDHKGKALMNDEEMGQVMWRHFLIAKGFVEYMKHMLGSNYDLLAPSIPHAIACEEVLAFQVRAR